MIQGAISWFRLPIPDLITPKRLLSFESQFPTPSTSSSWFTRHAP
jgi:hypothetical protein